MNSSILCNRKIRSFQELPSPEAIKSELPVCSAVTQVITSSREEVKKIVNGDSDKILLVVGPCSIHSTKSALDYAVRLAELQKDVSDQFFLVMRAYFEKPRTVNGWKGLLNDPRLDGSFQIVDGIKHARQLLLDIARMGVPAATEMLDLITPQYLADLISWSAIGARTTESQSHRELASGLSMPVGFKNSTEGNVQIAVNAIRSASNPHHFLSVDDKGMSSVFETRGNPDCHVILRGGRAPNYDGKSIAACLDLLKKEEVSTGIMVDCSHGNSGKDYTKQPEVFDAVINYEVANKGSVKGLMLESNLVEGNQSIPKDPSQLCYGQSITDACIGWEMTEDLIRDAARRLSEASAKRSAA